MSRIILASKSPRRKQLLEMLGLEFEVIVSDIVENINYNNDLVEEIKKLSYQKTQAVFINHQDAIVIGSDTIVKIDNEILGKPKTHEQAIQMLQKLSGNTHEVVTAVTIMSKDKTDTFASISSVKFSKMTDTEITDYVLTNEPMDKAGAYAIQGLGAKFVEKIDGDYYSVMGLPVNELYQHLKHFNI